jgi:hypothetical protein
VLEHGQPVRVLKVLVQSHAVSAHAQDACQRRLAGLYRLAAQIGAVEFEQVEGVEEGVSLVPSAAQDMEAATPRSSQQTTSPSIRQERTLRWFTASTTRGNRSDQSLPRRGD